MATPQQRFCPLCDRSFADNEAVLRCDGCSVMHHPACWVKNGGCATKTEHQSVPTALAYTPEPSFSGQAPHPGEGTRVVSIHPASRPEPPAEDEQPEAVIGAPSQPLRVVPGPSALPGQPRKPPVGSRAYAVDHTGKPMPKVYGGHRILRYWYVPAAVLLAAGVALAVIFLAGLFDDDGDGQAATGDNPSGTPTPATTAAATPTTDPAQQTPTALPGQFQLNDPVVVRGVGSGAPGEPACLNIRTEPGTEFTIIDCLQEGTQLTVLGGPEVAGGLTWWRVKLASGDGWAAEDYLAKR